MQQDAQFDSTGQYRYSLWRQWNAEGDRLVFIMLNPSTADAQHNDPTIRRCLGFARRWGYGCLVTVNLFAYRTPYPHHLCRVPDPVGPETDRYLLQAVHQADRVIAAWGNAGQLWRDRVCHVLHLVTPNIPLWCLGLTTLGQPRHPLYAKADSVPIPWDGRIGTSPSR
ncbi:MAG: DUF1643 domain-containing protein [Cyanobacteria bacterium]|nr:DUF1643 domain-containing protein [Cyanobacteriota bacterium]MDW8200825.1 DUF1643 domain-containing protein [Cyanobacteriota bacterium SKYGB_h_bin112]